MELLSSSENRKYTRSSMETKVNIAHAVHRTTPPTDHRARLQSHPHTLSE